MHTTATTAEFHSRNNRGLCHSRGTARNLRSLVSIILVWAVVHSTPAAMARAADLQAQHEFKIPAQPLGTALLAFSDQAKVQVLMWAGAQPNAQSPGAMGELTAAKALTSILSNTGFAFKEIDEETVAIVNSTDAKATATAEPENKNAKLEEIIVTAQKRRERLIDTPLSVSVVSSESLTRMGATQLRDFADSVPGLNFKTLGAGLTQISLRGVTTGNDVSSTVGIYVDEVPYGSSSGFASGAQTALDVGLFNLDRIEVLRGPQGTLYGASTMGGLLKYVTKRPDETRFGVEVQTGISDTREGGVSYQGAATVNAPIVTDKAALRVTGFYSRDGGYVDNLALSSKDHPSDIHGGRLDLLLTPGDALTIRLNGFLQDISRDGEGTSDYAFSGVPLDGSLDQRRLFSEPFDQRFRLVSGTVTYDLRLATLTSVSSYQTARTEYVEDLSRAYVPLFASIGLPFSAVGLALNPTTDKFTQELRLAAERTELFEWLIGGFYTHETSDSRVAFLLRDLAGQPTPNNLLTLSAPSRYEEYAAFGDLTWHLSDKFDVTGGVRYARNQQEFTQNGSGLLIGSTPTRRSSEDVFTYLANARYRFSDHATAYLRYATGYRPGGPNYVANDPITGLALAGETFEADHLKSYEAGIKAETADQRFGLDLAGYYINWSNIQILTARGGFSVYTNAPGGATVRGTELTLTARPIRALTVTGAFAYQRAQMSEADPDLGAAKGERLPNVPRFTAALNADYELPVESLQPAVGATLRYVDERTASFDDSTFPQYRLPDYVTVDLRAGVMLGSFNTQLYLRNLVDERGQQSAMFTHFGTAHVAIQQPRTIGISVTTHF